MIDRRLHLLALCLLITACAAPGPLLLPVTGGGESVVKQRLAVTPDTPWNRFDDDPKSKLATWTQEGLALDQLQFYVGIADGEPIAPVPSDPKAKQLPPFRAAMTPTEVVDLLQTHWTQSGSNFELERLEARPFAGQPGFRFQYAYIRNGDELRMRGVAFGAVIGRELFLIDYMAPRLGFFDRHLAEVEALAASARLLR